MILIHTSRISARAGKPRYVPGGLACAAAGRIFAPTSFQASPLLKVRPGMFTARSLNRLAPSGA